MNEKVLKVAGAGLLAASVATLMRAAYAMGKCAEVKHIGKLLRENEGDARFHYKIFGKEISFYAWDEKAVEGRP